MPAGSLNAGHLGALVEVETGHSIMRGRLKEIEHGRALLRSELRTKLNLDLEDGGAAWPYVSPQRLVRIIDQTANRGDRG